MAADAVVLGLTLRQTMYIFKIDEETRAAINITTTLAYHGKALLAAPEYLSPKNRVRAGTFQFG